jgi:hypothetical protein
MKEETKWSKPGTSINVIYDDITNFINNLVAYNNTLGARIESAAHADRLSREESDFVGAAGSFRMNIKNAVEHLAFLQKNLKKHYYRDIK